MEINVANMVHVSTPSNEVVDRMFRAGAHFGYAKSRRHPSTKNFIFGQKNKVEIFDLEKTSTMLASALEFVRSLGREKKVLLFVGGKPESHKPIRLAADTLRLPYVAGRWIGGTLTNWSEIAHRIKRLEDLKEQRERGDLTRYTKLERLIIDREITKLELMFGGLVSLAGKTPDALFIVDPKREHTAVREATTLKLPTIALANSDCDITNVTHPILGNDAASKAIAFYVEEVARAYREGLEQAPLQSDSKS